MTNPATPIRVAIIMAGGSGERFWPLSRADHPKQLLSLTHPDRTMLEEAVGLVAPLIPVDRVFVITSKGLLEATRRGRNGLPMANVIAEPARRNTCGCLAFTAAWLLAHFNVPAEQITMAVVTADHQLSDPIAYRHTLNAALTMAEREDALGIAGIKPTRPETGYGYVEIAADAEPLPNSLADIPTYAVARFREKPNREMAEELIETGRCYWNSGMFFWRVSSFIDEMERVHPEIAHSILAMAQAVREGDESRLEQIFLTIPSLPIDIALLERARRVIMTPGNFPWEDVGAWDALGRTHANDAAGNVAIGNPVLIDSSDSIVYNAAASGAMEVAVVGVKGIAVVVTDDAVLVLAKDRAQDVKRAVAELKKRGSERL